MVPKKTVFPPVLLRARVVVLSQLGMMPVQLGFERIPVATAHYSEKKKGLCYDLIDEEAV